jgi:colanic acid/amylovoran biosynthesis glycosyltransferase
VDGAAEGGLREIVRRMNARALVFAACAPDEFEPMLTQIAAACVGARLQVVCFDSPPEALDLPVSTTLLTGGLSPVRALRLCVTSLIAPFTLVAVCAGRLADDSLLDSLLAFAGIVNARERVLQGAAGNSRAITRASPASLLRIAKTLAVATARRARAVAAGRVSSAVPLLTGLARAVTSAGLRAFRNPPSPARLKNGRVAILVPIIPDLSHTFIYREVLALKSRHPDFLVIGLERGSSEVIHDDAARLLKDMTFVPMLSPARYLLAYLSWWCVRPRHMAAMVRRFESQAGPYGFLRLEFMEHANHVLKGFLLAEYLRRLGVSYVHVYGFTYPSVRMLIARDALDITFSISTFVDFDYVTPFHMPREKLDAARFVVVCTAFCAARLAERWPDYESKVRILYAALPGRSQPGPALRPDDGTSRVVFVGRYVPKKGLEVLLAACAMLKARAVPFTCHLYGAGEERDRLHRLIVELNLTDAVTDEGPIVHERFYTTLNHADVFVCPSRYMPDGDRDGIPVTLLEAMAEGLTVLSARVSGIPELVEDGVNGYLVPPDDPEALASRLAVLLTDARARAGVSTRARETIRKRLNADQTAEVLAGWISQESRTGSGTDEPGTPEPRRSS